MRILIEGYHYPASVASDVLKGLDFLENITHEVVVNYVGYLYNPHIKDCVFILPKVLVDKNGKVFSRLDPIEIINVEKAEKLIEEERKFLYEFAVWIYRSLCVFDKYNPKNDIVYHKQMVLAGMNHRHMSNTYLEVLLALIEFNRNNQNFFMTILKNIHSGHNKINWTRTIARSVAIIQKNEPIYLNPVNKKRQINFDEELLIIFFSILHYINGKYGFPISINVGFDLIVGEKFNNYLNGFGKVRLRQIKYKYFSDKALKLWGLCYAFFDKSHNISVASELQEYLIAKNYNIVFESMIDELVGDKKENLPRGLKEQEDGKRVDHMYIYKDLASNYDDKAIYYIGDSKYYKQDNEIGKESVYKQFTYARNVIQWNLDLFLDNENEDEEWKEKVPMLRDEITEGYNIIPNFFISAKLDKELSYIDTIDKTDRKNSQHIQCHFNNRLFDRDTLLITHYDVNFLFIISLYARNNASQKQAWKTKVRNLFRKEIQQTLTNKYNFYAMTPKQGVVPDTYIEQNFRQLIGKIYSPYNNLGPQKYYSLALDTDPKYEIENASLLAQLEKSFHIENCSLGEDPRLALSKKVKSGEAVMNLPQQYLTMHYLEKYLDKSILIGGYKGEKHLEWILGKNDRGTLIYNVRLGKKVEGGQVKARLDKMVVSFVVLYEFGHESENKYRVFHVHHHASMDKKRLIKSQYPSEPNSEKYFCYVFDEEVTLGNLNIHELLSKKRIDEKINDNGAPIFVSGKELLEYRR